ncbi:CRISPR-associated endonuclease Cas2 [Clostridium perfringens]|uniref:CRISPR-associated endonuclease Cas2 n=1 Tax=Clostridium perfringens TaxID=1502 RepID=UPI001CC9BFEA|nr:CRISPR-associated endonuclease Cas2 [Clostridium perfringens]MCC5420593.1 CRISPR-associated endonuclease Cas2 [Clostridium perfringens]MCC5429667.1 CRISPR-associated endonuclease Cas2 [Clostridium perfringens]MCC5444517.1 CRISPR-associated endonuclease Cas2 [Clostridium perfringens]MCC5447928.1 CRISPR-associated endonuclease Cas2 [Clostridium perfringens]MDH2458248.1 CRISPR-associated endonuclease Cas2 [Clostridium perfringens]
MSKKFMRILVFFDLPVVEKEDRKEYQNFRRFLLNDGYLMIQFSVYSRICNGIDGVNKHVARLKENLPPKGSVRYLQITEKQYTEMKFLVGSPKKQEKKINSRQLNVF